MFTSEAPSIRLIKTTQMLEKEYGESYAEIPVRRQMRLVSHEENILKEQLYPNASNEHIVDYRVQVFLDLYIKDQKGNLA
jgi:hypothetical protein